MNLNNYKILVIMPSLTSGGAEKALINFLEELKKKYKHIDLLLFQQNGLFYDSIPDEINILQTPIEMQLLYGPFENIYKSYKYKPFTSLKILIVRLIVKLIRKAIRDKTEMAKNQYVWIFYDYVLKKMSYNYDIAIAYQQTHPINFLIRKVDAKIKIGWMHSSYIGNGFNKKIDYPYFKALDALYAVSEECYRELLETFDNKKVNIKKMNNIISNSTIKKMSKLETDVQMDKSKFNIVTVGRLEDVKGYELMLESMQLLSESDQIDYCLYIIGEGSLKHNIIDFIEKKGLKDKVILLGTRSNPYPIISSGNLYIQTSKFEGYGIAIKEASILNKPLLLTNFNAANLHVKEGYNGLIVSQSAQAISDGILNIFKNYSSYQEKSQIHDKTKNDSDEFLTFTKEIEEYFNEGQ